MQHPYKGILFTEISSLRLCRIYGAFFRHVFCCLAALAGIVFCKPPLLSGRLHHSPGRWDWDSDELRYCFDPELLNLLRTTPDGRVCPYMKFAAGEGENSRGADGRKMFSFDF